MAQASVTLVQDMLFAVQTGSGHSFTIDSGPGVGGSNAGPRPMELVMAGAAGCTAMDVISILRKMQQKVTGLRVEVNGEQAEEHPKKLVRIHIKYIVTGYNLAEDRVARAIELSETKYCPVMASLRPGAAIELSYEILEAAQETTVK